MHMILSRHGNTFAPGDKVVWVGGSEDVPLVPKGEDQARALAGALNKARLMPVAVYCAPLRRTRGYAEIVLEELDIDREPIVDERLLEIDYGAWAGLSSDEIVERFGEDELHAWQRRSVWPSSASWKPGEHEISARIEDFLNTVAGAHGDKEIVLVITSNGILRYFLKPIPGAFYNYLDNLNVKVSTGNICRLGYSNGEYKVVAWNKDPCGGFD